MHMSDGMSGLDSSSNGEDPHLIDGLPPCLPLPSFPLVHVPDAVYVRVVSKLSSKGLKQKRILLLKHGKALVSEAKDPFDIRRYLNLCDIRQMVVGPEVVLFKVPSAFDLLIYFSNDQRNIEPFSMRRFTHVVRTLAAAVGHSIIEVPLVPGQNIKSLASLSKEGQYRSPSQLAAVRRTSSGDLSKQAHGDLTRMLLIHKAAGEATGLVLGNDMVIEACVPASAGDRSNGRAFIGRRITHVFSTPVVDPESFACLTAPATACVIKLSDDLQSSAASSRPSTRRSSSANPAVDAGFGQAADLAGSLGPARDMLVRELVLENEELKRLVLASQLKEQQSAAATDVARSASVLSTERSADDLHRLQAELRRVTDEKNDLLSLCQHLQQELDASTPDEPASSPQPNHHVHQQNHQNQQQQEDKATATVEVSDIEKYLVEAGVEPAEAPRIAHELPVRDLDEARELDVEDLRCFMPLVVARRFLRVSAKSASSDRPACGEACARRVGALQQDQKANRESIAALKQQIVALQQRLADATGVPRYLLPQPV